MDNVPNTYFVTRRGIMPAELTKEGLDYCKAKIKRLGGPWHNGNKPPEAYIVFERLPPHLPLEVKDVWVVGCINPRYS